MRFSLSPVLLTLLYSSIVVQAADSKTPKENKPCTVTKPSNGLFYDLRSLQNGKKLKDKDDPQDWKVKGLDYGANFTLNICNPVTEKMEDVVGVKENLWRNVSAFYELDGKKYSIGQASHEPIFRGSMLVLNYTDGSPCHTSSSKRSRELVKGDDEERKPAKGSEPARRKHTVIVLKCVADLTSSASISFIYSDECAYFFEARSPAACGVQSNEQQAVGPGGVFGIIVLIAVAVYLVGGIAYQRTVMHQRGWRQLPNYSMWAGMGSFLKDMTTILFSSCARFLPSRKGYNQLPTHTTTTRGRTASRAEDENRLIDQLDEEWDD